MAEVMQVQESAKAMQIYKEKLYTEKKCALGWVDDEQKWSKGEIVRWVGG